MDCTSICKVASYKPMPLYTVTPAHFPDSLRVILELPAVRGRALKYIRASCPCVGNHNHLCARRLGHSAQLLPAFGCRQLCPRPTALVILFCSYHDDIVKTTPSLGQHGKTHRSLGRWFDGPLCGFPSFPKVARKQSDFD